MKNTIKNHIFTHCKLIYPILGLGLLQEKDDFELIASSENENKLVLKYIDFNEDENHLKAKMFIEFSLGKQKHKNPCFILGFDFINERAEVLSFESDLFPKIKLNVYTEVNSKTYKNIVAEQDLDNLCYNWLKQLNELNYRPVCTLKN